MLTLAMMRKFPEPDKQERWPKGREFYKRPNLGYKDPKEIHKTIETIRDFFRTSLSGRKSVVLDHEWVPINLPHSCYKDPERKCVACAYKDREPPYYVFVKLEANEVPERLVEWPVIAKVYKKKRWQTEHKAALIQKKWNKRVANQVELVPVRTLEYYSLSTMQFKLFSEFMRSGR